MSIEENITPSNIGGMGEVSLPTETSVGSGDVPAGRGDAEEEYKKKRNKKKHHKMKNIISFESFSTLNEGKFDGIGDLVKSLHFEMDPKTAEEKKIELGKRQGEVTKRKQIEGGNYSLRRFRKEIKYWDGNKRDQEWAEDVFAGPDHYNTIKSTLGAGPHAKPVKKVRWNQRKYDQWLKDVASNDGWKNAFDMAQNAQFEPGLVDWVKKEFPYDDAYQRIQWDIEAFAESVVTEAKGFKNTKDFEAWLEEIEGMPERQIRKIMGKDYIDTPGFWADEKDDYEDIIDFMMSNMGSSEFEKLQDYWEDNVEESVVTEGKLKISGAAYDLWDEKEVQRKLRGVKIKIVGDIGGVATISGSDDELQKVKDILGLNESVVTEAMSVNVGEYIKTEHGYFYKRVAGEVGGQEAFVEISKGKEKKRKTSIHNSVSFEIVDKEVAFESVEYITEKKLDREDTIKWIKKYMDFVRTTEDFNGSQGGIWVSGEDGDEYKGATIYDYYTSGKSYELGVNIKWEKELNKRGWYSEWYDAGTVMIWEI